MDRDEGGRVEDWMVGWLDGWVTGEVVNWEIGLLDLMFAIPQRGPMGWYLE
jgi:hypothetical protein